MSLLWDFFFLISFRWQYKKMQAIKLIMQVNSPIIKAWLIPYFSLTIGVMKTLAISPISGKMKVSPATFPIQLDAKFP